MVVLVAGIGVAIDRWRRANPDIVDRLEAFDRAPTPPRPQTASPQPSRREPPDAAPTTASAPRPPTPPLDLNRATPDDLQRLPGIGPGLAARIVDARDRAGAFGTVEELRRVRGIGRTTLERLRPLLAIGPAP